MARSGIRDLLAEPLGQRCSHIGHPVGRGNRFFTIGDLPAGITRWIACAFVSFLVLVGGLGLPSALGRVISTKRIRHASRFVLPEVSPEPVILAGSVVDGRVLHDLVEDAVGWQLRPAMQRWRRDRRWLLGLAVPLGGFAAAVSWFIHQENAVAGWAFAISCGIFLAFLCGSTAIFVLSAVIAARYRLLSCLSIPRSGTTVEFNSPQKSGPDLSDLTTELRWNASDKAERQSLMIPRESLRAVQLCPWKHVVKSSSETFNDWAVQGLLVLAGPAEGEYSRVPILLSSDVGAAAVLLQRLAAVLAVPYLFGADAEGFQAEQIRAKHRPPLHPGRMLS